MTLADPRLPPLMEFSINFAKKNFGTLPKINIFYWIFFIFYHIPKFGTSSVSWPSTRHLRSSPFLQTRFPAAHLGNVPIPRLGTPPSEHFKLKISDLSAHAGLPLLQGRFGGLMLYLGARDSPGAQLHVGFLTPFMKKIS